MPKTVLFLILVAFAPLTTAFTDADVIDFDVPIYADANLVPDGIPGTDTYWVETDGTEGIIILRFQDSRISEIQPCELPFFETCRMELELTIPDVPDAGSEDGLIVTYGGTEVGRIEGASAGSDITIPLEACSLIPSEDIVLVLYGSGPDGLAVASKASGSGAVLRVIYFPEYGNGG